MLPPLCHDSGSEVTTGITKMSLGGEVSVHYDLNVLGWQLSWPLKGIVDER